MHPLRPSVRNPQNFRLPAKQLALVVTFQEGKSGDLGKNIGEISPKIMLLCMRLFFPSWGFLLLPLDLSWRDHKQIQQNRIIRIEEVLLSLAHMSTLDHNIKFLV
jgi:hypothetical protein